MNDTVINPQKLWDDFIWNIQRKHGLDCHAEKINFLGSQEHYKEIFMQTITGEVIPRKTKTKEPK